MRTPYTACDALLARKDEGKIALVDGARRVSYAELLQLSFAYANALRRAGVTKGDRVGIFLRRSLESVAALYGTWLTGAVAVVMNEQLRARQVEYILGHSDATCMVTDSTQLRQTAEAKMNGVRVVDADTISSAGGRESITPVIGADLAVLMYTSGSTGLPKGVMVSHGNLVSGTEIVADYLKLSDSDVILSVLPFSFDYGLNQLLTSIACGGTLVIQRALFPSDICKIAAEENVTGIAGIPMFWLQMTSELSPFLKCSLPKLRYITSSGGRLATDLILQIRRAHPNTQIFLMYGLTEAFRSTYLAPEDIDARPSSIGKPIRNVEVMVVNASGTRCRAGEIGELVHRGANIALGYWRDPESTGRVFRPHPFQFYLNGKEEVVVYTGDLVTMDDDGYLFFIGRKDQQIKSRGFRISPEEVETWIGTSNLVSSVVAFAIPTEADEDIGIAVIPRDPQTFREEALDEFCKRELPEYMRPRAIFRASDLPKTTTGKADRNRIRDMYHPHEQNRPRGGPRPAR